MNISNSPPATSPGAFVLQKSVQLQQKMLDTILQSVAVPPSGKPAAGNGKGQLLDITA